MAVRRARTAFSFGTRRMPAASLPSGYLSGRAARRMLGGASPYALQALAIRGEVRTLVLPGCPPSYRREDVEKVAQARQRPSSAQGA